MCPSIVPGARRVTAQLDSFPLSARRAVRRAAELGFDGIGLNSGRGTFAPQNFGRSAIADLTHTVRHAGLVVSHLAADTGRPFSDPRYTDEVAEKVMRIIQLASDIGAGLVSLPSGFMPESDADWDSAVSALRFMGLAAGNREVKLAVETGPFPAERLQRLVEASDTDSVSVCFTPGALLVAQLDVAAAAKLLAASVDLVAVRDLFVGSDGVLSDAPFGEGRVPWPKLVDIFADSAFQGFYTVRRAPGADSELELKKALEFLRTHGLLFG